MKKEIIVETFTQRCLKCSNILKIEIEQKEDKVLKRPETYKCEVLDDRGKKIAGCGHEGKFGEKTKVPKFISSDLQTIPDNELPPVIDEKGNPCLVVNGKRVPFTLGRIQLVKKEIAVKMALLDNLEKNWVLETNKE